MKPEALSARYRRAHDAMRNIDGLQPHEAFDELLKYLFFKQMNEETGPPVVSEQSPTPDGLFSTSLNSAKAVRSLFKKYVQAAQARGIEYWPDKSFRLSNRSLVELHSLFESMRLSDADYDVRSTALKEFLSAEARRGLGIYLTPDPVVRLCVQVINPAPDAFVYDPACGSGTFLLETLRHWRRAPLSASLRIFGADKNERMLQIAELNLAHQPDTEFAPMYQDALAPVATLNGPIHSGSVDHIFTNPPFGVAVDPRHLPVGAYAVADCLNRAGNNTRIPSELLFIEQCLRLLKPGGTLAIVLPRSVITNSRFGDVRLRFGQEAFLTGVVLLPPETFATAGTQTTTCVLFLKKYTSDESPADVVNIAYSNVTNVGYDSTGRHRTGSELSAIATQLRDAIAGVSTDGSVRILPSVSRGKSIDAIVELISEDRNRVQGRRLGDIVEIIRTGRTPARSAYVDQGLFILKVGNLTGAGIDWQPRDRNFVPVTAAGSTKTPRLRSGDIVLTSSAHTQRYIAKKVDIVESIPNEVGGDATFVGEVMLIRSKSNDFDPYRLLGYLRMPHVVEQLQGLVRGQTAHLMPKDVAELQVPEWVFRENKALDQLTDVLRKQTELTQALSRLQWDEQQMLRDLVEAS